MYMMVGVSMKMKIGLSKEIIIIIIMLSICSTVFTGYSVFTIEKNLSEKLILQKLTNTTELAYNLVSASITSSIRNYLRAMVESSETIISNENKKLEDQLIIIDDAILNARSQLLTYIIGSTGYMYLVNTDGTLLMHKYSQGDNIRQYDFVQEMFANREGYMEYAWKNPGEKNERTKAAYYKYYQPKDFYIVASSYRSEFIDLFTLESIEEKILSVKIGENGYLFVIDSRGDTIIHPKAADGRFENLSNYIGESALEKVTQKKDGSLTYVLTDIETGEKTNKMMVYKYFKEFDWYVCSSADLDELYASAKDTSLLVGFSMLMILLIFSWIGVKISGRLVNPIIQLRNASREISYGNYDLVTKNKRKDEIGELTQSFNTMVVKTTNYISELKEVNTEYNDANINLEKTIHKRTEELADKNKRLEEEVVMRQKTENLLVEQNKELEKVQVSLEKLSQTDSLTGLYNRHYLNSYLENVWKNELKEGMSLSIIMMDIDYFKGFNDTYGHVLGDYCLKKIATSLIEQFNKEGYIISRFGGEEFCGVVLNENIDTIVAFTKEVLSSIPKLKIPHSNSSVNDFVTLSIGVAHFDNQELMSIRKAIEIADLALYTAKDDGRNQMKVTHNKKQVRI